MSVSGYIKLIFRRLRSAMVLTLSMVLFISTARADIVLIDLTRIQLDFSTIRPVQELKNVAPTPKQSFKYAYDRFVQESAENGVAPINVLNTFEKDEKSVAYVQAKHFRFYVMPNIRETPSEMERIALNHQTSGTQSKMLVMTK
jgi:hypothetical protein